MKLATAEQMRRIDSAAIKTLGIPGVVLMENAGVGTINAIISGFGPLAGQTVLVVAGPGNNGGDGLVIARHAVQHGAVPLVFLLADPNKIKGEAAINLAIVKKMGILVYPINTTARLGTIENGLTEADLVVDAIFGTGLTRPVDKIQARVIERINTAPCPVISADIPSGLDSDTGQIWGTCVRADMTVTYGLAKPGHFIGHGPEVCGNLGLVDIGIPPMIIDEANLPTEILDEPTMIPWIPERPTSANKGTFGHLLVVAGSRGKSGAALLAALGGLRAGAGLVTLALPGVLRMAALHVPEVMTLDLSDEASECLKPEDFQALTKGTEGKKALVVGPGLGQDPSTGILVSRLYREIPLPMVLDADGLNLLAAMGEPVKRRGEAQRILTPHPGEMARLTGLTVSEIQENRLEIARKYAKDNQVILVLKGASTIIASPNGQISINPTGNPILATGGTGDVLAGVIGALLVQGVPAEKAARLGVYLHGRAADNLARARKSQSGLLASELANAIPLAMNTVCDEKEE